MFGNYANLFFHAVIVGNYNVKTVEKQSAGAYFTCDITWILCNACNPTFIDRSSVPHAWGTLDRKSTTCVGHTRPKKHPF